MPVKLFVGQVPQAAADSDVRAVFDQFGPLIDAAVIRDADGRSKGCAFVTFESGEDADQAIQLLHEQIPMPPQQQPLQVKVAQNQAPAGRAQAPLQRNVRVFVGHLPAQTPQAEIRDAFAQFGALEGVYVLRDRATGTDRGSAFVTYGSEDDAERAVSAMNGQPLRPGGQPLLVEYAMPQRPGVAPVSEPAPAPAGEDVLAAVRAATGGSACTMDAEPQESARVLPPADGDSKDPQTQGDEERGSALIRTFDRPGGDSDTGEPPVKLFVGQIPYSATEEDVVQLFAPYGDLAEVVLIPDPKGERLHKGAGFVKYWKVESASSAINNLDGADWGDRTMQVRFADSTERNRRGVQRPSGASAGTGMVASSVMPPAAAAAAGQQMQAAANLQQVMGMMWQVQALQPLAASNPQMSGLLAGLRQNLMMHMAGQQAVPPSGTGAGTPAATGVMPPSGTGIGGGPRAKGGRTFLSGPVGANLIVHGLSDGCTENDLQSLFAKYGNIVSCTVYRDKDTNLPKGFGFVSFDSVSSAVDAIVGLDGLAVQGRRLEVRVKQQDLRTRPY
eukprot:TRINITY_DN15512_c0_g1_i1.p1 TRINITY_DN15512_c0_g1~~TRINITY_DN15512_c0_g1_i1.p1  ORF type:complete len:559 (+),score=152.09 TRINITY_DN15512_c0_g1_i1:50-1726(+)